MRPDSAPANSGEELEQLRDELEDARRKLAEAHKMASLGRLAAGIVHEINTPIGSIFSNNDVVLRSLEKTKQLVHDARDRNEAAPQKALDLLETMSSLVAVDKIACERISSIIRSLKTFARVNEGDLRKIDLREILQSTIKLTSCVFRRNVQIEPDFAAMPEIECYPALLSQVFLNLVVNAAQAIEGDGIIKIHTDSRDGQAHIAISDNGSGISPQNAPKIFSAGFSTKAFGEGTGLGLSISREIVEDTHGGKIWFESQVGVGTTFHILLPFEQPKRSSVQPA